MQGTGIGTSLMLIALGAILAFAVNFQASGLDIKAVGGILMVVGVVGLMLSFIALGDFSWFGRRETTFYEAPPVPNTHVDGDAHTREEAVSRVDHEERVVRR